MSDPDILTNLTKIALASSSVLVACIAIYYNKRLSREITKAFKAFYGKTFGIEIMFDTNILKVFLRSGFIIMGICAFLFAVFNIIGPIN